MIWLAHALTLARIPLAALFVALPDARLGIVIAAALTDALDGSVARYAKRHGATSTAGDWLDPACDKLFVAVCLVASAPSWVFVALVLTRELLLLPFVPFWHFPRKAAPLGKLATDIELVTIGSLVVPGISSSISLGLAVATSICGAAAAGDYLHRGSVRKHHV